MTRDEARAMLAGRYIVNIDGDDEYCNKANEAIDMAISALSEDILTHEEAWSTTNHENEQNCGDNVQNCCDLISRADAIDAIKNAKMVFDSPKDGFVKHDISDLVSTVLCEVIHDVPSVSAKPKVAFICDGRACEADCSECFRTTNVEHAEHFERLGDTYMEAEPKRGEWIPLIHETDMTTNFPWERDGQWVIVTDGKSISVERFKKDAYDHFFPDGRWFEVEHTTAWMPLPQPYGAKMGVSE